MLRLIRGQDIPQIFESGLETHYAVFAQRIDRWVGHLAEILAEEVRKRSELFRQNRNRTVIAHRADGLFAILRHRREDELERFEREASHFLPAHHHLGFEQARFRPRTNLRVEIANVLEPFFIGVLFGKLVDNLFVLVELPSPQISSDHTARLDMAAANDFMA